MPFTRIALIVSAVFFVSLVAFSFLQSERPAPSNEGQTYQGQASVGGPFTMLDHNGNTVTESSFGGRKLLIYFGFTFCPDICPTELQALTEMLDMLSAEERAQIQPLFVTVDPERDTPEKMKEYLSNFHGDFIGLTGSPEQVAAALKGWRIYWQRVDDPSTQGGFTYDHSALTYVMDENNTYLAHFSFGTEPDAMAEKLRRFLN